MTDDKLEVEREVDEEVEVEVEELLGFMVVKWQSKYF